MKRVLSRTTTAETVASGVGAMSFDLFFSRTTRQKSVFFKTTTTTKKRGEEEEDVMKSNARKNDDDHRASHVKEEETETKARKEQPENAFLESLRRETEENLRRLSDARVPPTRKFSQQNEDVDSFSKKKQRFRNRGGGGEAGSPPKEINGPRGLEPTRFNDWEIGGRCTDF